MFHQKFEDGITSCGQTLLKYFGSLYEIKQISSLNYKYNARWGTALEMVQSGAIRNWAVRSTGSDITEMVSEKCGNYNAFHRDPQQKILTE